MTDYTDILEALATFPDFVEHTNEEASCTHDSLTTLQVNVGLLCNLACKHCHVQASPARTDEVMNKETLAQCLDVASTRGFSTIDFTGGAPEMNPHFEWALREAHNKGLNIIARTNLVILLEETYTHFADLYAELGVTVFASLPHYDSKTVNKQRGDKVFERSIQALQHLNELGYGKDEDKQLNLVFNPVGAVLPPDQSAMEREYKQKLLSDWNIVFNNLFAITNNPAGRFGQRLITTGNLDRYMGRLMGAFNPAAVPNMMCRDQLSVSYDGHTFDCDFNQAMNLPCENGLTIADYAANPDLPLKRHIAFGNHCYACTAGAGSSCGGTTAD